MTKVNVISGFLGAGKTTLIKKLLDEALKGEKIVLIENEFGEIGIDSGFLKDAGVEISEMNSGCICCSLVGDFGKALGQVMEQFQPDRILIEPSGVGKLSDVVKAVEGVIETHGDMELGSAITVADATKCKVYMKNFGEFYLNQIENAGAIVLSRTQKLTAEKLEAAVALLREKNDKAPIVTTDWSLLTGEQLLSAMESGNTMAADLLAEETCPVCGGHHHHHDHEHHHHDHDEHCACGCHDHEEHDHHHHDDHHDCGHHHGDEGCVEHHHGEHEHCAHEHHHDHDHHEHHHHEHDEHCCGHDHHEHHHHDHDEHCTCGCHDHDHHHHHHHADEVFTSWGVETTHTFTESQLQRILTLLDTGIYGAVLRAKGILPTAEGTWLHFDYVPDDHEVRTGAADYTGRLCVIGSKLDEKGLAALFEV